MLKNYKYSLFAILVSTVVNLFVVLNPAPAASFSSMGTAGAVGCEGADFWALDRGQALEVEGAGEGIWLRVERAGYLLAEAYSWRPGREEPRVTLEGAGSGGVDWLAGRLLALEAGDYCIRTEANSAEEPASTRLVLALSPYAPWRDQAKDGEVGDEVPDDPIGDILFRSPGPGGLDLATKDGEVGDEVPDDPIGDILFRSPGLDLATKDGEIGDEVPDDPIGDILFADPGRIPYRNSLLVADGRKSDDGTGGDEVPDDPIGDILFWEGSRTSGRSIAGNLGLCGSTPGMSGALACASDLPVGKAMVSSLSRGPSAVETYTFEVGERTKMALLAEGSVAWMVLYDQSGRRIARTANQASRELIQTLAPGRYMVRIGTGEAGGWYSLAGSRLGS